MRTVIIIIAALLVASCGNHTAPAQTESTAKAGNTITLSEQQQKNAGIVTAKAQNKNISSVLKLNGQVDVPPQNRISISVPLGGYLKSTVLLPGMYVRKGETIAVMEDQQYIQLQQDYLTAVSQMNFLEKEFKRQKELNADKSSSDKLFQQTEADYKSQRILVKSLSEKLKLAGINPERLDEHTISRSISISSPADAYVSQVNVNTGKYVMPSDIMFELLNPKNINLSLTVFEKDLGKISAGQKLEAYTNQDPAKHYECEVILVSQDIEKDRSAKVFCRFSKYNSALKPGMYMNAEIQVQSNEAPALPDEAVVMFQNRHYVFRLKSPGSFEMLEVSPGASENGFTQVEGLTDPNAEYVIKGAYSVLMAMKNKAGE